MPGRSLFLVACLLAILAPFVTEGLRPASTPAPFPGWPTHFEGRLLRPLPLDDREKTFAEAFPGRVGRFTDGSREIIFRWVTTETRKLHPAMDCFKGLGFSIQPQPLLVTSDGAAWSRFTAERESQHLDVREHILDSQGQIWTDVSAWYWAALLGRTHGPWWTTTVAEVTTPSQAQ